ncbi:hypothetical protein JCM17846_22370 [Iodidimonas nitroreducens]|uniref:Uncharacterized protein n=1 Tax=Iodidimonas nitroreducens TaxID=1236968 RepID=A0A5A7NA83_9PROT|nr:hypothetical protein JCM17846_22370 [Iodidimonas nitroreducens]
MVHSLSTSPIKSRANKAGGKGKSLTGAQWRMHALEAQDVESAFGHPGGGYPGGPIMPYIKIAPPNHTMPISNHWCRIR